MLESINKCNVNFLLRIPTLKLIYVFTNCIQGELLEDVEIQKQSSVSYIEWHPHYDVLAVGWENGEITVWLKQDNTQIALNQSHKTCVSVIAWNRHGNSLVSGDEVM